MPTISNKTTNQHFSTAGKSKLVIKKTTYRKKVKEGITVSKNHPLNVGEDFKTTNSNMILRRLLGKRETEMLVKPVNIQTQY